jgi:hypothetical protein
MLVPDMLLERVAQFAVADDDETRVGDLPDRDRCGVDEVVLAFVRDQRGDVADDRRLHRQVERGAHVRRLKPFDAIDVHAFVDDGDLRAWHAVADETIADHAAVGDEPVHLRVSPSRERRVLQTELGPPRRDMHRLRLGSVDGQRRRRHRHANGSWE